MLKRCCSILQDLLQKELQDEDALAIKDSAQGLGLEVGCWGIVQNPNLLCMIWHLLINPDLAVYCRCCHVCSGTACGGTALVPDWDMMRYR